MRVPDGHGWVELTPYRSARLIALDPLAQQPNTFELHRIMFPVDDCDDTVARLRVYGAERAGEIANYDTVYCLRCLRGPEGIIMALASRANHDSGLLHG